MSNLYERLGGADAVDAAVGIFYQKVLADDRVNGFFTNIDMAAQERKQKLFLTMVFGGPNGYGGKDMREGHKHLGLEEIHFDAIVEHLGATLTELGVPTDDIAEVAGIANSVKDDVLNR